MAEGSKGQGQRSWLQSHHKTQQSFDWLALTRLKKLPVWEPQATTLYSAWRDAKSGFTATERAIHYLLQTAHFIHRNLFICDPHPCIQCNHNVDRLGTHELCCCLSKGMTLSTCCGQWHHVEPSGLCRSHGKWPSFLGSRARSQFGVLLAQTPLLHLTIAIPGNQGKEEL